MFFSQKSTCLSMSSLNSQICRGNLSCTGTTATSLLSSSMAITVAAVAVATTLAAESKVALTVSLLFLALPFFGVLVTAVAAAADESTVALAVSGVAWAGVALDARLRGGLAWAGVALGRGDLRRRTSSVLELLRGDFVGVTWAGVHSIPARTKVQSQLQKFKTRSSTHKSPITQPQKTKADGTKVQTHTKPKSRITHVSHESKHKCKWDKHRINGTDEHPPSTSWTISHQQPRERVTRTSNNTRNTSNSDVRQPRENNPDI